MNAEKDAKRLYESPVLDRLGSVGSLTAGGSGAMAEMDAGNGREPTHHP